MYAIGKISILNNLNKLPWPEMAQKWKNLRKDTRVDLNNASQCFIQSLAIFHPDRFSDPLERQKTEIVYKAIKDAGSK